MPHYIATKELKELATDAINSMKKKAFIVSVDDGSPMDTKFLDDISGKVIRLEENSGFAKACNAGFNWALDQDVEYVGCANNDIKCYHGWLEALLEPFRKWDNVGITGIVHSKDKEVARTEKGTKITEGGLLDEKMQNGGLWLSTKETLCTIAPDKKVFDERFEIGGEEDVDLFLTIRDVFGMLIVMSNKSVIWHKEGATRWNDEVEPGYKAKNKAIEQANYDRFASKWGFDIREKGLNFYEYILEK